MGQFYKKTLLFTVILLLLVVSLSFSQRLNFRNIDSDAGLPQEQVTAIYQDNEGYIWLGSFAGVSKYNGYKIEKKFSAPGQLTNFISDIGGDDQGRLYFSSPFDGVFVAEGDSLKKIDLGRTREDNYVFSISRSPLGKIYLGTATGIFRLEGLNPVKVKVDTGTDIGHVNDVIFLSEASYFLCSSKGLFKVNNGVAEKILPEAGNKDIAIFTVVFDGEGELWVGAEDGLYTVQNSKLVKKDIPELSKYESIPISCAIRTPGDDTLWFGCELGVIRVTKTNTSVFSTDEGLLHNTVRFLFLDKENSLWMGTNLGASILRTYSFIGFSQETKMKTPTVSDLMEDSRGRIIAANGVSGIYIIDEFEAGYPGRESGLKSPVVFGVGEMENGEIILGNKNNLVSWDGNKTRVIIDNLSTSSVLTDSKRRVWVSSLQGVFLVENGKVSQPLKGLIPPKTTIYGSQEDQEGRIWFCSRERGCLIWDGNNLEILGKEQGLEVESTWCVDFDSAGRAWIGTNGGGVFVWDGLSMGNYNSSNGLPDNYVWQVLVDSQNNIWLGTNEGVSRFDGKEFILFTEDDGLVSNEGQVNASLMDSKGNLWFASSKGISKFAGRIPPRLFKANMTIESIFSGKESIPLDEDGKFSNDENSITFKFAALSYRSPKNIVYSYILEGADEQWNEVKGFQPVAYSNLAPGRYQFKVKARYLGQWSESVSYSFTILNPFYLEWWFYLICILGIAGLIYLVMYTRAKRIEKEKVVLDRVVKERTKELVSANEELKTFNTAVSNNLLVPLRHITGFCELIKQEHNENLTEAVLNYLDKISHSAGRQRKLIHDLLILSQAGSRKMKLVKVDLSEMLISTWHKMNRSNPGAKMNFDLDEKVEVYADISLMESLLLILLSNSLKATASVSEPRISLKAKLMDGGKEIAFGDNGIGFNPSLNEELFEPFSMIHKKKDFQGSGLGLNIALRIIQRHGGLIWAEGTTGQGAVITFFLPEKDRSDDFKK